MIRISHFKLGDHRHIPLLTNLLLGLLVDVTQVANHNIRTPTQTLLALSEAGLEQIALGHVSGCGPTDQRDQKNRRFITAQPQTQRVLFITHVEPGVTSFQRASPEGGQFGGPPATVFFLSAADAGRSVASMIATVCPPSAGNARVA